MTISGVVKDSRTGEPIRDARIVVRIGEDEIASLFSGSDGSFSFSRTGEYGGHTAEAAIQKEGYETRTITYEIEDSDILLGEVELPLLAPPPPFPWRIVAAAAVALGIAVVLFLVFRPRAETPTFAAAVTPEALTVAITSETPNARIRFVSGEDDPGRRAGIQYEEPIEVRDDGPIRAVAYKFFAKTSTVGVFDPAAVVASPRLNPSGRTAENRLRISIQPGSPGAPVSYAVVDPGSAGGFVSDPGSLPELTEYTAPFYLDQSAAVAAVTRYGDWNACDVAVETYRFKVAQPEIRPAPFDVQTSTSGARLRASVDGGSELTIADARNAVSSLHRQGRIAAVRAVGYKNGYAASNASTARITPPGAAVLDFRRWRDGPVTGREFGNYGITRVSILGDSAECDQPTATVATAAINRIRVKGLTTAGRSPGAGCSNLPIVVLFGSPVRGVSVHFSGPNGASYTLRAFSTNGRAVGADSEQVNLSQPGVDPAVAVSTGSREIIGFLFSASSHSILDRLFVGSSEERPQRSALDSEPVARLAEPLARAIEPEALRLREELRLPDEFRIPDRELRRTPITMIRRIDIVR